jgi:Kef-type K+ transport system membrane component KefB
MTGDSVLWHLLLALAAVVIAGRLLGALLKKAGQPPVVGEIVAGILLGPSLLGRIAPEAFHFLFPQDVVGPLGVLARLGVILYMFVVGVELNSGLLRGQFRSTIAVSLSSVTVPFLLGCALALYLHPRFAPPDVRVEQFAMFVGVAMSITAFPVLARLLADRGMMRTRFGALALSCAAVNDLAAWALLALVAGSAHAGAATHAIFVAFLIGAIVPHNGRLAASVARGAARHVVRSILPAYFAFTGLRTEVGLVSGADDWTICAVIILVATAGKFGGSATAARLTGLDWRHAAGLGLLMNTRGLMELVVLNVGLDLGIISPALFAMMVLMALATTVATAPLLSRIPGLSGGSDEPPTIA